MLVEVDGKVEASLILGKKCTFACLVFLEQDGATSREGINWRPSFLAMLDIVVTRN